MKALAPAEIRTEPATLPGVTFLEAAGGPGVAGRCLWPLSGAGADMVVCGGDREPGSAYCQPHRVRSGAPAARSSA